MRVEVPDTGQKGGNGRRSQRSVALRPVGAFLLAALGLIFTAQAQRTPPTEYEVKAAYLYNFGKFVEWPSSEAATKGESFEICVLGDDPFGAALDTAVTGAAINGKNVAIKRITKAQEIDGCRILFISSSESERLPGILGSLDKANVLTVSDMPQFSERGGMIQFVLEGKRVRFEVNLTNAEGAGLNLSSELLKVALRVTRDSHSGS
jgi:hypothetical protein